ncbi:ElaB/YqjD/DUF883 family membrane-anchored ribosome-binding protein [Rhodoblastus acidophilus]|uniref:DUF883 family protein n=1 Tax=Rhodoblastus acidophilus TaxID=1074 RepID=UPI002224852E|nr:hypothetical protein [Rhodoblastus acidophilus]MCW2318953.1 ElaB/YqjD/DUF883 family membrane-anchored ribosome-binding protein [Rhodoblastus acidophilus]
MKSNVENVATEIATDFAALQRDIVNLTDAVRGLLDQQTQTARERVSDAADGVKDKVARAAGDVQKGAVAAGDEIAASIERNPLTAILIAVGLGLLVGMISRSHG